MKYLKIFGDSNAKNSWKESNDYIEPNMIIDESKGMEIEHNYRGRLVAEYDLNANEDECIMRCGNIFDSLIVNGEELSSGPIEMGKSEFKDGDFGSKSWFEFTVNSENATPAPQSADIFLDKTSFNSDLTFQFLGNIQAAKVVMYINSGYIFSGTSIDVSTMTCIDEPARTYSLWSKDNIWMTSSGCNMYVNMGYPIAFVAMDASGNVVPMVVSGTRVEGEVIDIAKSLSASDVTLTDLGDEEYECTVHNNDVILTRGYSKYKLSCDGNIDDYQLAMVLAFSEDEINGMVGDFSLFVEYGYLAACEQIDEHTMSFEFPLADMLFKEGAQGFTFGLYHNGAFADCTLYLGETSYVNDGDYTITTTEGLNDVQLLGLSKIDYDICWWPHLAAYSDDIDEVMVVACDEDDLTPDGEGWKFTDSFIQKCNTLLESYPKVDIKVSCLSSVMAYQGVDSMNSTKEAYYVETLPSIGAVAVNYVTTILVGGAPKEIYVREVESEIVGVLGKGITSLPSDAFSGTAIKKVVVPHGIEAIGSNAFAQCEKLETVCLPKTVNKIYSCAFINSIKEISCLGIQNVEYVAEDAFRGPNYIIGKFNIPSEYVNTEVPILTINYASVAESFGFTSFDTSQLSAIYVDGVQVDIVGEEQLKYSFASEGEHVVKYVFKDKDVKLSSMFFACTPMTYCEINLQNSKVLDMSGFGFLYNMEWKSKMVFKSIDTSKCSNFLGAFAASSWSFEGLEKVDFSNAINMKWVFMGSDITNDQVKNLNIEKAEVMDEMLSQCELLTEADLSSWDTSHVTSMEQLFYYSRNLAAVIMMGDVPNVVSVNRMFADVAANGVFTYSADYDYSKIIEVLPSSWSTSAVGCEFIDLGLPSGLKWGSCNLGAMRPEEYGLYFAWGETEGYVGPTEEKQFDYIDYKWWDEPNEVITKYNTTDNLTSLQSTDDAATAVNALWRTPTKEDLEELIANTDSEWVVGYNGTNVNGRLFTSKVNGKTIFVPAAGMCEMGNVNYSSTYVILQSSSIDPSWHHLIMRLYTSETAVLIDSFGGDFLGRVGGASIRPVKM